MLRSSIFLSEKKIFLPSYLIGIMQNEYIRWKKVEKGTCGGKNMGLKEEKSFSDDKYGLVGHI